MSYRSLLVLTLLAASMALAGLSQSSAQQGPSPRQNTDVRRVLVIPVNLRGRAPLAVDRAQIAQALYGTSDSVAARYRAISYGKVQFTGSGDDITAPVTLAEPSDFCGRGLKDLANEAANAVRSGGTGLSDYQHFVFVIPKDAPCWWTGVGDIGGNRVWVKATTAKALQHELGHNLGMDHAVYWRKSDAEGSDFMGSGGTSLNAPHVIEMGWLRDYPGKIVEPKAAADVTLEALESDPRQSPLPKVAIVQPAPGANTYYLSYRASSAANPLGNEFTQGLNVHVFNPAQQIGGLTYFVAGLSDGGSYSDGPMVVRQLSHIPGQSVTFHIDFAGTGQAIAVGPPPAPLGTVQSLASGKCIDLPHGQTADGTPIIQYDCHGGPNQQWTVETSGDAGHGIVSRMSGKCLVSGAAPGNNVQQSACGDSRDQLWTSLDGGGGYALRNVASHLCLDIPGGSVANGTELIVWTCNGGTNQIWRYAPSTVQ